MKYIPKLSFCFLVLFFTTTLRAQVGKNSGHILGTPCTDCPAPSISLQKGGDNSVQNGNQSLATSYTTTACGLNYVTGSVVLGKRGSIGGVTQPANVVISGLPACFTIVKAFLYSDASGNGIATTATVKNPLAASGAYPMTIIGTGPDKCWSSAGYSATYSYRADITPQISGNGTYQISGLPVGANNDTDGATMVIIYTDPTQLYTGSIVIADGAHEVSGGSFTDIIGGFKACAASTFCNSFMLIGDLQKISNTTMNFNSATSNYTQLAANDLWWNCITTTAPNVTLGQTTAQFGAVNSSDCYNAVAVGLYYRTNCNVCTNTNLTITPVTSGSCAAGSATANVTGGTGPYSYTWSPIGGNAQTVSGVPTGVYTVTVKDATGCKTGTATINITAAAAPTITANSGTVCAGSSATLTSTGALTYTWSPGATLNTTSGNVVVATPPGTTTYSVSGTNAAGCVSTITVQVVVNPIPVPTIGSNSPVCLGSPINLTSGGGTTYSWSGPNAFSSAVQNPIIPGSTAAMAGVYTVTATSLGCSATKTISVVISTPTTSATNTGPYCAGATIQLNAPAATSYTWSGPAAFASNLQNPVRPASTVGMSGTYTVIVSIGTCTAAATTIVTVNALPIPTASNTGPYCAGATIQLNASASTTYSWSGPSAFTSNVQNPTQAASTAAMGGVYTVTVSNASGCVSTASTTVVINPIPTPIVGSNSPVCLNNTINLTSAGGTTYSWSGPNAFASAAQNPNIPAATAVNSGVYTVTVTSAGCSNTGTVNVVVTTPTTSASNTGPYCAGSTIQLNTNASTTYTWTGPAAFASNIQNPTRPASIVAMSGVYTVIVSIGTCTATATTSVTVNPLPLPTASNTGPYCPGNTIQLTGSAATSFTWSGPSAYNSNIQSPTIAAASVANGGTYTINVTDANGCKNTATTNVVVNPSPVPVVGSNSPVCLNNTINLTSAGGTTYSWSGPNAFASAIQNPNIPAAAIVNSGVYTVTVTALGCSSTGTVNVTVTTPTTSISNTGPYCAGTTIQLNAPAASSYTWTGPSAFASNLQNPTRPASTPLMSGTYTVIVSIGTCTATATTSVTVNALPTPLANSNSPVCVGNPITFTGTGGVTYFWGGPAGYTVAAQNPTIAAATAASAGTYTLLVVDANTCTNVATTNVVINPLPVIVVNSPTVCLNQAINLTATGGVGYSWSGPGGFTSALQNPNIPSAAMTNSGQYTVTVTSVAGCTNTGVGSVNVFALPVPAIVSNTPCVGSSLNLTGNGGATYAWSGPGGFTSILQNPNITNVTLPAGGTYTLIASAGTCSASTTAVITINPLPTPVITNSGPVCIGTPINFTGAGGTTYVWSGPAGFNSNTQNPNIPASAMSNNGSYTLTVTDANGCVKSTSQNVVVNAQPIITSAGASVCQNANANLSASGGVTYNWSGPGGYTSTSQNPVIANTSMAAAGQYTVLVTNANSCTNTAVVNLAVTPAPVPSITTNGPVCINNVLVLSGTGGVSYSWSGPNGFSSTAQTPTLMANTTAYSGTYMLTVTDANGCSATTNAQGVISPIPNISIITNNVAACAPACMTFSCVSTSSVASLTWSLGNGQNGSGTSAEVCYETVGIYTINATVIDVSGCTNSTTYTTQVYPKPTADFNYDPIKPIESLDMVSFTDASFGATITSWNWYFMSNAQYTSNQQNPQFLYTDAGPYPITLVVTSDKGCKDTIVISILVGEDFGIYVPNAFTPNGDGLNDIFYAKGFGVTKFEMNVMDRWGEKVFTSTNMNDAWDGSYEKRGNKMIEEGVYTWIINVTNVFGKSKEFTGHVTLIK